MHDPAAISEQSPASGSPDTQMTYVRDILTAMEDETTPLSSKAHLEEGESKSESESENFYDESILWSPPIRRYNILTDGAEDTSTDCETSFEAARKGELEEDKHGLTVLQYQTIKCINMPPRIPGLQPEPQYLPYDEAVDYKDSMLIYWLDDLEMKYSKAVQLWNQKFPDVAITDESFRRRHLRLLNRLAKKYGVKQLSQSDETQIGRSVKLRGAKRVRRGNAVKNVGAANQAKDVASRSATATPKTTMRVGTHEDGAKERNNLLKVLIVAWKDVYNMDFKDIQQKLEDECDWDICTSTVQKYYDESRNRAYDTSDAYAALSAAVADFDAEEIGHSSRNIFFDGNHAFENQYLSKNKKDMDENNYNGDEVTLSSHECDGNSSHNQTSIVHLVRREVNRLRSTAAVGSPRAQGMKAEYILSSEPPPTALRQRAMLNARRLALEESRVFEDLLIVDKFSTAVREEDGSVLENVPLNEKTFEQD